MLDIKWIRENADLLDQALEKRSLPAAAQKIIALDKEWRSQTLQLQQIQEQRNSLGKEIPQAIAEHNSEKAELLKAQLVSLKKQLPEVENKEKTLARELEDILLRLPNIPHDDVPIGKDEKDNKEVRRVGDVPAFSFPAQEHYVLGEELGLMNFDQAAKISGARFTFLQGALSRLERAIGQFMLDLHTSEHGYTEVSTPLLVRDCAVLGTAQLPKFSEDLFQTTDGRWLIPTAEVPLTNQVRDKILEEGDLPLRFTALTPCFRSEAGSAGRDTRGMLRQHQFWKVELVSITRPEDGEKELERMTLCAEEVLKKLGLPYRTVALCSGDMGFSAKKTYDLEVWLPGQNTYREISSCSWCGDFQARRMQARYRKEGEKGTVFVHTLNGSGTAVGRCLIAILENYQQKDGSIVVPEALHPYMGGLEIIKK